MVWTYKQVEKLRKKHIQGKKTTLQEKRNLEKYVRRKKSMSKACNAAWHNKQLLKAERLLQNLKEEKITVEVE